LPQALMSSIDDQTVPTEAFEVIVVDCGLDQDGRASADRLARHRTNVRIVEAGHDLVDTAVGGYTLRLRSDELLFPQAVHRLTEFAQTHSLDIVIGRTVQPGHAPSAAFLEDRVALAADAVESTLSEGAPLVAADRVRGKAGDSGIETSEARIGVLGSYPILLTVASDPAPEAGAVVVSAPAARWTASDLELQISGTVSGLNPEGLVPSVLLRHLGTQLTYVLPSAGTVTAAENEGEPATWTAEVSFSPLTAAAGEPLVRGLWQLEVAVASPVASAGPVRIPGVELPVALLDGMIVVPDGHYRKALRFEVGGTRLPVVADASLNEASVTETAAGSLLRVPLRQCHVQTAGSVPGFITLDRLKVPATIETDGETAVLSAYVSGLAGTYPVAAQFGRSMHATGLALHISGTGEMRLDSVPAPVEPPVRVRKPKSPAVTKKRKPSSGQKRGRPRKGVVARVRRAVPGPLEPYVRWVAKHKAARTVYRRVTRAGSASPRRSRRTKGSPGE